MNYLQTCDPLFSDVKLRDFNDVGKAVDSHYPLPPIVFPLKIYECLPRPFFNILFLSFKYNLISCYVI